MKEHEEECCNMSDSSSFSDFLIIDSIHYTIISSLEMDSSRGANWAGLGPPNPSQ